MTIAQAAANAAKKLWQANDLTANVRHLRHSHQVQDARGLYLARCLECAAIMGECRIDPAGSGR
jgi:hypothetical protein